MGWHNPFKSKKKTVVSSQIYNLAGDGERENFLKRVVFNAVFMEDNPQLGSAIAQGITSAPAFKLRHYIYWLKHRPKGKRYQDIIGHYYLSFNSNLGTSSNALAEEFKNSITIPEHWNIRVDSIEIDEADYYFWGAKYLADNHEEYLEETLYDYEMDFSYKNNKTITIHIFDITLPARPEINTLTFQATDYVSNVKCLYVTYQLYPLVRREHPITHEVTYEEPTEITVPMTYFIYKNVASDHADYDIRFAGFFKNPSGDNEKSTFLVPPIPFRLDNWQVSDAKSSEPERWELYKLSRLACTRALGDSKQYSKISKQILDNESIGDIDYCYLLFGVSLNTKDKAGKEYLFRFTEALYRRYLAENLNEVYMTDREGYSRFSVKMYWSAIYHGFDDNTSDRFPKLKKAFVDRDKYTVLVCTDTWEEQSIDDETNQAITINKSEKRVYFVKRRNKQATEYEWYSVAGFEHENYVHDGKCTYTKAIDTWDYEEVDGKPIYKESSFIYPIHEGIFHQMTNLNQAQMSHSFAYLLFNAYEVKKVKWYQRGAFKIVMVIIVVIIAAVCTYFSYGSGGAKAGVWAKTMISAITAMGAGTATAMVITALIQVAAQMLTAMIVSKLATKGMLALGIDVRIAAIASVVLAVIATAGVNGFFTAPEETITTTTTVTETFVDAAGIETTNIVSSSTTSLFQGAEFSVYSIMTSPIKLLELGVKLFESGTQAHFQHEAQKLQSRQKEIEQLQSQTELLQQELRDMQSQFAEWAQKLTLWKLQTSVTPEVFFDTALASGSDIIERVLRYPSIFLDCSPQLS